MTSEVRMYGARQREKFFGRSASGFALVRAKKLGYREGIANHHTSLHNFRTGREWIAWLKGWRRGQRAIDAPVVIRGAGREI